MENHEIDDDDELIRVVIPDWLSKNVIWPPVQSAAFDNTDDRTMSLYSRTIIRDEGARVEDLLERWSHKQGVRLAGIRAGDLRELGFGVVHSPDGKNGIDHAHVIVPGTKPPKKRKKMRDKAYWLEEPEKQFGLKPNLGPPSESS